MYNSIRSINMPMNDDKAQCTERVSFIRRELSLQNKLIREALGHIAKLRERINPVLNNGIKGVNPPDHIDPPSAPPLNVELANTLVDHNQLLRELCASIEILIEDVDL